MSQFWLFCSWDRPASRLVRVSPDNAGERCPVETGVGCEWLSACVNSMGVRTGTAGLIVGLECAAIKCAGVELDSLVTWGLTPKVGAKLELGVSGAELLDLAMLAPNCDCSAGVSRACSYERNPANVSLPLYICSG